MCGFLLYFSFKRLLPTLILTGHFHFLAASTSALTFKLQLLVSYLHIIFIIMSQVCVFCSDRRFNLFK